MWLSLDRDRLTPVPHSDDCHQQLAALIESQCIVRPKISGTGKVIWHLWQRVNSRVKLLHHARDGQGQGLLCANYLIYLDAHTIRFARWHGTYAGIGAAPTEAG